ncbi:hypothetical protein F5Y09DRAFT_337119 [Xylaria sp. FL1042]|nr:hypothetical protein F5Y09DRAFT_337119 [Xylaria sp. FL1042]
MHSSQPFQKHTTMAPGRANPSPSHASHTFRRSNQESVDFAFKMLKDLKVALNDPKRQCIPKQHWPQLNISCDALDLMTGAVHPSTPGSANGWSFLKLMPPDDMQDLAALYNLRDVEGPGGLDTFSHANFYNADDVAEVVNYCLWSLYNNKSLIQESPWDGYSPDDFEKPKLCSLNRDDIRWMVPWFMQPKGSKLPHVNCFLVQDHRLEEDSLLFSEVWCILILTLLISRRLPTDLNYPIVPVTLISTSSRDVRIVQGWVDGEAGKIRINKSAIEHMGEGQTMEDQKVYDLVLVILRWLLAQPTWKTS